MAKFPEENPYPVGRADYNGKVIYCNQACGKKQKVKIVNQCRYVCLPLRDIIKKIVIKKSNKAEIAELKIDGKIFSFLVVPVKEEHYINFYGRDVTELRKVQENLKKSYERIKNTLDSTIKTLAVVVETKDPYTAGHQVKVAKLSAAIAKELKLDEQKIDEINKAATIHDIGKIAIPQSILSKPSTLTSIELSLIKTHSKAAYDILKHIDFGCPIADIILQHHERENGSGYPNGLDGSDTMLETKIIAVADVVEAISSHRPYRPALGIEKALEEIESSKNILYDTAVVDVCIRLFKEGKFRF